MRNACASVQIVDGWAIVCKGEDWREEDLKKHRRLKLGRSEIVFDRNIAAQHWEKEKETVEKGNGGRTRVSCQR